MPVAAMATFTIPVLICHRSTLRGSSSYKHVATVTYRHEENVCAVSGVKSYMNEVVHSMPLRFSLSKSELDSAEVDTFLVSSLITSFGVH